MKINKPKFWSKKIGFISIILLPISFLYLFLFFLKKKFTKTYTFKVPVICVGNIYIGGTGKTPISIRLANVLGELGKNPVILRKYYSNHVDEYNLIQKSFKNLILNSNRASGLKEAEQLKYRAVILDDGFQDHSIKKNFNIVCFNQKQLIGNGLVLPSGPLRENISSLAYADVVIINGDKDKNFENKILKFNKNLNIFYSNYKPINLEEFKNRRLLALAGIGNPDNFFEMIEKNSLKIEKRLVYPDHYKFSKNEIMKLINEAKINNYKIIMTEKDYFKIKNFNLDNIGYLKIELKIENQEKLIEIINNKIW